MSDQEIDRVANIVRDRAAMEAAEFSTIQRIGDVYEPAREDGLRFIVEAQQGVYTVTVARA
jgi:hypothetical protein